MRRASLWLQTVTLVKRNVLIKLRIRNITFQEIFMPIYFVVLLAILKTFAYKPTPYNSLPSTDLVTTNIAPSPTPKTFFVAPNLPEADQLMRTLSESVPLMNYTFYNSQAEMDAAYKNLSSLEQSSTFGIYFPNSSINHYALRFKYNSFSGSFKDSRQGNCRQGHGNDTILCPANNYWFSGFAAFQNAIDTAIAKMINPNFTTIAVAARIMPKDPTLANTESFMIVGPLYMVFALGPFLTMLLVFVVYEKEKKIKEGMKMMGLDDIAYWLSWGIVYAASLLIMTLVMAIIGRFGNLFPKSNFFLIFLLLFIYGISIEMLGYMLTPFFNKARTAGAVGGFVSIIMSLIFLPIQLTENFPVAGIWAVSLLSPTAFAFAMGEVFFLELAGDGVQFDNLTVGDKPVYIGLVMMVVDIFLYFILTLYLDNVVPSEYGQRKSVFYCLKPSYWCKGSRGVKRSRSSRRSITSPTGNVTDNFEPVLQEMIGNEAITFQNVRKVFQRKSIFGNSSKETVAVQRFNLEIYKGQITALLGHNGAGKTTLFNILTGFVPATSGNTNVYGYDVSDTDDMAEIRKITGVCPQHDILIDKLSVKEHLEVFAGIKGFEKKEEKDAEIERVMGVIGLEDQKNTFAAKLSGGQKRKLSVGIAILGDPKILILDEPTAGMDPYSRRKLWDLLRSNREERVTLLTTHFMDEADILADRKAILAKGKLKCVGSSLFLKNRFGVGYHLGVVSKSHDDQTAITSCVLTNIQDAELQRSVGMEHAYTLPLHQVANFPVLFSELDKRQDELNVQSYGVSMTTLEEVFLKIGEDDEEEEDEANKADQGKFSSYKAVEFANPAINPSPDGSAIAINLQNGSPNFDPSQGEIAGEGEGGSVLLQLMRRTLLINLRNKSYVFFAIILPIIIEIVGTWLFTVAGGSNNSNEPPLIDLTYKNNLKGYENKSVLYKGLTGSAQTNFVTNVPQGVVMEESTLADSDLLKENFWPHMVGLDISTFTLTQAAYLVLYNTSFTRSLPSAINLLSNSLTSYMNSSATNIVTYSKEWPQVDATTPSFNGGAFGAALMVAMAIVTATSFAAGNPVKEREQKIKTQLRVSGVEFSNYWGAFFLGDYVVYFVMAFVFIICILGFQVTGLNSGGAIAALILLLLAWGAGCLLASYVASFLFDRYETVQAAWPGLVQLMSILPYIIVSTLDQTNNSTAAMYLNIVFMIFSPYYVGFSGIYYCFKIYLTYLLRGQQNSIPASAYFDWSEPMMPLSILMAYLHIVLFSILLVVTDVKKSGGELPICRRKVGSSELQLDSRNNDDVDETEDADVAQERTKVAQIGQQASPESPVVVMEGLRKEFAKRTENKCTMCGLCDDGIEKEEEIKVAVRNLSMTVYPGEVLGLLGPNGAGKTTALNVLIADTAATRGRVAIGGNDITSPLSDAFKAMGYCPQMNPLWSSITLKEHLEIYATIRGVKKLQIPGTVNNFMEALDIMEHKDKRAKALSGGTKRKLCFAISMLANPQVVLLDEPSTGMDPKTKRFLWNTISTAFEGTNRGAILTTHYMEEADALCSRVGILVRGQLRCLGSTQHLKDKFGQGYILEVKLDSQFSEDGDEGQRNAVGPSALEEFVTKLFPSVEVAENFGNRLTYKIKKEDVESLATVFSSLEESKGRLGIEEYSFSQSTLEQVFLRFAKEQAIHDEEEQQKIEERKRAEKLRKKQKSSFFC